ncbi:MAG TPA: membrane dipeptidase [bacterium]|nr:membrane dipeptidase [bacterium]
MIPIADIHTHPLIPMYYYRKDLGRSLPSACGFPYTPFGTHIDVPRLKESGVKIFVACVYAVNRLPLRNCFEVARAQIRLFDLWVADHPETFARAKSPEEVDRAVADGKIAAVLAVEGGHHLDGNLLNLDAFEEAGVFYLTLTHFLNNGIAESSLYAGWSPEKPLTGFGRELISEMNLKGIAVDVAHCSEAAFWEVAKASRAPLLYSHGGVRPLCDHERNLTDDQARAVAASGGLVGLILYPGYLKPGLFGGSIDDALRHLEHWLITVGPKAIALGSDMNGVMVLKDVKDYAGMPRLADAVVNEFGEGLARKILFDNALGYMKRVWKVAQLTPARSSPRRKAPTG